MNKITRPRTSKKIVIMILIVTLFNFVMPNFSIADDSINGGIFFKPIAQFITHIADLIIQMIQGFAIGTGRVDLEERYIIRYSCKKVLKYLHI